MDGWEQIYFVGNANVWIDHFSTTQPGILCYELYDFEGSHICVSRVIPLPKDCQEDAKIYMCIFFQKIFATHTFPEILSTEGKINLDRWLYYNPNFCSHAVKWFFSQFHPIHALQLVERMQSHLQNIVLDI